MKFTEIKALVPGAGKTTTLVRTFSKRHIATKSNQIILTPSNKNKQNIIKMLQEFGVKDAHKFVKTLREFKQNFVRATTQQRVFNCESMEYEYKTSTDNYYTTESKFHYKKVYDVVYIDEASMISDKEIQDLIKHWKIKHLVLCGDANQFAPIPNYCKLEGTVESEWIDEGEFYKLPIDHQILLNKSMRAKDKELEEVIELIKDGEIIECIGRFQKHYNVEPRQGDWNIAYTNKVCDKINKLYESKGLVDKVIVVENDKKHGFSKSEILDINDQRFEKLRNALNCENWLDWKDWQKYYLKPAMCITSHKLQGTTISEGRIRIHLNNIINGIYENENIKPEDKITTIQKFLYIAVSRACRFDQIQMLWYGEPVKNLIDGFQRGIFQDVEDWNIIQDIDEACKPMLDEDIITKPDWIGAADDKYSDELEAVKQLLIILKQDTEALELEGEKEYLRQYKTSRSKYSIEDINFAGTHTLRQAKERGWTQDLYYKLRNRYKEIGSVKFADNKEIQGSNIRNKERNVVRARRAQISLNYSSSFLSGECNRDSERQNGDKTE